MGNFWRKKDRKFNKNVSVRDLYIYIYIVYIYILSDEHLGANLSVTENRCVLFDSFTYIYIYIYLFIFIDVSLGKSQIEYSYMNLFFIFFPHLIHVCPERKCLCYLVRRLEFCCLPYPIHMWSLEGAYGQPISVGHWISCDSRWVFGGQRWVLKPVVYI